MFPGDRVKNVGEPSPVRFLHVVITATAALGHQGWHEGGGFAHTVGDGFGTG